MNVPGRVQGWLQKNDKAPIGPANTLLHNTMRSKDIRGLPFTTQTYPFRRDTIVRLVDNVRRRLSPSVRRSRRWCFIAGFPGRVHEMAVHKDGGSSECRTQWTVTVCKAVPGSNTDTKRPPDARSDPQGSLPWFRRQRRWARWRLLLRGLCCGPRCDNTSIRIDSPISMCRGAPFPLKPAALKQDHQTHSEGTAGVGRGGSGIISAGTS